MSRVEVLRAEYEAAVAIAELEDELAALKASKKKADADRLRAVKEELRSWRYVLRLPRDRVAAISAGDTAEADKLGAVLAELEALKG